MDIVELWRQQMYPHHTPETFTKFIADTSAEGWDEVRQEVAAVKAIVDSLVAERDTLKAALEHLVFETDDRDNPSDQGVRAHSSAMQQARAALAACVHPPQKRDNGKHNTPHDCTRDPETQMCVICGWAEQAHNFACVPPQETEK